VDTWIEADDPPFEPGAPVLTHGDLRDGNLLLDAGGRAPTAVLDWIDLSIADPARDFGGLLAWRGEPFLLSVLAHASLPPDDLLLARARRRAAHLSLAVAWQGVLSSRPHLSSSGLRGLSHSLP
jgi:aminoglycoside phosphotransferase (APT) family kinase protein